MKTEIRLFDDYYNYARNYYPKGDLLERLENFVKQSKVETPDITAKDIVYLYGETMYFYHKHAKDKSKGLGDVARELLVKKTQDYNSDKLNDPNFRVDDARENYFPFGDRSYMHMLWTKALRVKSVMGSKQVNFESMEDSLIDMANYLAFYYSFKLDKSK